MADAHQNSTLDRHTSIRSVLTLPAYTRSVRDNETVIGREGDRSGIDIVIETPETAEEEEVRRDSEMESLYQIRAERRREAAEMEVSRQRRREARRTGDTATLARLQEENHMRALEREVNGAQALIQEHASRSRERRVSSVDYASVGVARHDGSRVRASSIESERGLLDSAASMGGVRRISQHRRDRSASSAVSDTEEANAGFDFDLPPFARRGSDLSLLNRGRSLFAAVGRSRASSGATATVSSNGYNNAQANNSSLSVETSDVGGSRFPDADPPVYERDPSPSYGGNLDHGNTVDSHSYNHGHGDQNHLHDNEEAPPYTSPISTQTPAFPPTAGSFNPQSTPPPQQPQLQQSDRSNPHAPGHNFQPAPTAELDLGTSPPLPLSSRAPVLPAISRLPSIRIAEASPVEGRADGGFLDAVLESGRGRGDSR